MNQWHIDYLSETMRLLWHRADPVSNDKDVVVVMTDKELSELRRALNEDAARAHI